MSSRQPAPGFPAPHRAADQCSPAVLCSALLGPPSSPSPWTAPRRLPAHLSSLSAALPVCPACLGEWGLSPSFYTKACPCVPGPDCSFFVSHVLAPGQPLRSSVDGLTPWSFRASARNSSGAGRLPSPMISFYSLSYLTSQFIGRVTSFALIFSPCLPGCHLFPFRGTCSLLLFLAPLSLSAPAPQSLSFVSAEGTCTGEYRLSN